MLERVHDLDCDEDELDWEAEDVSVLVELGVFDVDTSEGSLSESRVISGRLENFGSGGHSKVPGPGPNPHNSIPPPPQKEHPNKTGIIVL